MKKYKTLQNSKFIRFLFILIFLILLFMTFTTIKSSLQTNNINQNEVPYLSAYYIKPIVKPNEEVIIDYYISDYDQESYINKTSKDKFTVTVKIEGKKDIIKKNIKPGDNSISLGKFKTEGEHKFSIIATDQHGRNSHELFNFILVQDNINTNEYVMTTDDLSKYNIDNSDNKNNGSNTRAGLQKLLDDKSKEGYNKLKLIPGIYRIDHTAPIYIPTEFTLDLNQATIKLNGFTGDKATMIELNNTFNSHVINGTIEGDYYEHDYKNSPNNSEWVNGISISGESKYSSFENLTVKNITGYGGGNGIGNSRDEKLGYTYIYPQPIGDSFKLGDIDRKTGEIISSKNRTTSDFIDINGYDDIGYLSVSRYLGYQGNPCNTWNLVVHYYDNDKNFIQSTDSYQYRRIEVPNNASYMKVTILGEDYPTDLSVQLFRVPTHCAFKNIKFENCRAVGLAQAAMKDMLVENCEFTKCGQSLAKCAYDAEDGWDMMQDVTFRGLNFYDNPNNEFLTCAGHNFTIENMKNGKIYLWPRTNSYTIRNNKNLNSVTLASEGRTKTGYTRFYNNTINSNLNINGSDENTWPIVVKDSIINGSATNKLGSGKYINCNIGSNTDTPSSLGVGEYIDSYIHDKSGENHGGIYKNCTIENITGNIHGTLEVNNSTINNFDCYAGSYEPTYLLTKSSLNNFKINFGYWHQGANIKIEDCNINNDDYLIKLPHYSMKQPISLINNQINSNSSEGLINFYDDRTGGSAGELTKQKTLLLKENTISLPNSKFIIYGIDENTVNNINITSKNNKLKSSDLKLCPPDAINSPNIKIKQ